MPNPQLPILCPAQARVLVGILAAVKRGPVVQLWSGTGMGKTTILKAAHAKLGGRILSARDFIVEARGRRREIRIRL